MSFHLTGYFVELSSMSVGFCYGSCQVTLARGLYINDPEECCLQAVKTSFSHCFDAKVMYSLFLSNHYLTNIYHEIGCFDRHFAYLLPK